MGRGEELNIILFFFSYGNLDVGRFRHALGTAQQLNDTLQLTEGAETNGWQGEGWALVSFPSRR